MNEDKYPCDECEDDELTCMRQQKYLRCGKWLKWFRQQWRGIQKLFNINVPKRHKKKGGDDE